MKHTTRILAAFALGILFSACAQGGSDNAADGGSDCTAKGCACQFPTDCADGLQCSAQGVCCDRACDGGCESCNLAGSEGTCTLVAQGEDPSGDCQEVDCSGFFFGWTGSSCHTRANVSAVQATCDGKGSCIATEELCAASLDPGPASVTCDSQCSSPDLDTCTGQTAGVCEPAMTSCGQGECKRTVQACDNDGNVNTCTPGTPAGSDTCGDGLDNNCNGLLDEDDVEPNNACAEAFVAPFLEAPSAHTFDLHTIHTSGDKDFYQLVFREGSAQFGTYISELNIIPPADATGSYEICKSENCADLELPNPSDCRIVPPGETANNFLHHFFTSPSCSGGKDEFTLFVMIRGTNGGNSCTPYSLSYDIRGDSGPC